MTLKMLKVFGKKTNKSYENIKHTCTVRFLDDSEPLTVIYEKDSKGQWMLDHVCEHFDLVERDYFGLRFVDSDKQRHWLDPIKTIHKQLKHVNPSVLCFRVKFYPTDPLKLKEDLTRYLLVQQLRRDLHHGRLLCTAQDANNLAAYIIQSEIGDYDPVDHEPGYVSKFKMLPKQTARQEDKIAEIHKTLTGQSPEDVEKEFLTKAAQLDTYGVDPHPVKDQKGNQMYLGVTHLGIVTFQGNKRTHLFKWPQITKIAFEGKMFIVHVITSEKKHACGFKCGTFAACKHLWKCANEQRYFFTLDHASSAPKVTSGGGFLSRGSKFRFSGRCQQELYEASNQLKRPAPAFVRSISNPNISHRSKRVKSESVPVGIDLPGNNQSLSSLNSSVHSVQTGEANFDYPNGDAVSVTTHDLPLQPVKVVSDTGYSPYLTLPRGLTESSEHIQTIPEDSVLVDSRDDDQVDLTQTGSFRPGFIPFGAYTVDPSVQSLDQLHTRTEPVAPSGPRADSLAPSRTQPDGLSTEAGSSGSMPCGSIPVDSVSGDTPAAAVDAAEECVAAARQVVDQPSPQVVVPRRRGGVWGTVGAVVAAVLVSAVILLVLVVETDWDLPVIRQLRHIPTLHDLRHKVYHPFKQAVGAWLG